IIRAPAWSPSTLPRRRRTTYEAVQIASDNRATAVQYTGLHAGLPPQGSFVCRSATISPVTYAAATDKTTAPTVAAAPDTTSRPNRGAPPRDRIIKTSASAAATSAKGTAHFSE